MTVAGALALAGCSSGSDGAETDSGSPSTSTSTTPSPSSTVDVPGGVELTDQGSDLSFGDPATVIFESTENEGTVLRLTVRSVRQGRLDDFKGFILDDAYKKNARYFYAKVRVQNVGEGDVGGVPVPLWGVNAANTLLPAVNFTTTFRTCPSMSLPAKFGPGKALDTCLVFLSPDKGELDAVSYRPSQEFDPIVWKGTVEPPKPTKTPKKAQKKAKKKG